MAQPTWRRVAGAALGNAARWLDRRSIENPLIPLSSANIVEYLGGGSRTWAGVDVSPDNSLQTMAVWRAVNLISSRIAALPLKVYRTDDEGIRQEVTDLPLFRGEAYPDLTWYEFLETTLVHLLLWGNSYSLKIRNEAGDRILRVLPIEPSRVEVSRGPSTEANPSGKRFRIERLGDEYLTPYSVMHVPGLGYDGLRGLSPIAYARQAIGVGMAAEQVAGKMFDSGLLNAGYIQVEPGTQELTKEDAERIKRNWREKVAGVVRSYEIAVLESGLKYVPATIPPREAQWLEAREYGVEEIARLYGVPADLLMDNSATGNTNVEQRAMSFVKFGLHQWITRLEKRITVHLAPRATFAEFVLNGLLRGDALSQANVYASAIGAGYLTVNEVRALENLPPLPEEEPTEAQEPEEGTEEPDEDENAADGPTGASEEEDDADAA